MEWLHVARISHIFYSRIFNIVFAWLGVICFLIPLIMAIFGGGKGYCNNYCGRGQLFLQIGNNMGWSRKKVAPRWLSSKLFRHGFLLFSCSSSFRWLSSPQWLQKVLKIYIRPFICYGLLTCHGIGLIPWRLSHGRHSLPSDSMASCSPHWLWAFCSPLSIGQEPGACSAQWETWHN